MDKQNNKRRNGLTHARLNFSQSETRVRFCWGVRYGWGEIDKKQIPIKK